MYVTYRFRKYSLFDRGENTGRFYDVLGAGRTPRDAARIALLEDRDAVTVDDELAVLALHFTLEASVDRVILEHVNLNIRSCRHYVHLAKQESAPCTPGQ